MSFLDVTKSEPLHHLVFSEPYLWFALQYPYKVVQLEWLWGKGKKLCAMTSITVESTEQKAKNTTELLRENSRPFDSHTFFRSFLERKPNSHMKIGFFKDL